MFYYRKPSWWSQRTTLEKILTVITILAMIAMAALAISLVLVIFKEQMQGDIRMLRLEHWLHRTFPIVVICFR